MNMIVQQQFEILDHTYALRHQLWDILTDADLAYALPGNPPLGELIRAQGDLEASYVTSFTSLTQSFDERPSDPAIATSVARLRDWFTQIEADLKAVVGGLSDADLHSKVVVRQYGFTPTLFVQYLTYRESLLIHFAKVSVYLKALGKQLTPQWMGWIAA